MAADAEGETVLLDLQAGKGLSDLVAEDSKLVRDLGVDGIHENVAGFDPPVEGLDVMMDGVDHGHLSLAGRAGLGKGIQTLALDLEDGLDPEEGPDGRRRGRDPSALFQIFQSIEHDIDARIKFLALQDLPDPGCVIAVFGEDESVLDRPLLGDGDPLVVDDEHSPAIFIGQHPRVLAGAGKAAAHGDVDHLIIFFQGAVPHLHQVTGRRLTGHDLLPVRHHLEKFLAGQVDILIISHSVHTEGHGHNADPHVLSHGLCDSAVAVSHYCDSRHGSTSACKQGLKKGLKTVKNIHAGTLGRMTAPGPPGLTAAIIV